MSSCPSIQHSHTNICLSSSSSSSSEACIKQQEPESTNMVKFSKQFEGQLVPEWKEAFVDYWKLKKDLKKIHALNTNNNNKNNNSHTLTNILKSSIGKLSLFGPKRRDHHGPIQVSVPLSLHKFMCKLTISIITCA